MTPQKETKREPRKREIKLTQKETLAMYRNACYSGMGIRSNDEKPTDFECVQWLTRVRLHAEKLQANHELNGFGLLPHWKNWIKQPLEIQGAHHD